ncbi:O-antigen ligase family protein [Marinobacter gelidimuriae]|uniref:O-antigen ligase family protein n=1 Tax=Marinobacter gelidimuriae TaxID=2739064 RepID=UPI0015A68E46|nr:O-antigen ligase family protein [Marinobacter gelidimuriae]
MNEGAMQKACSLALCLLTVAFFLLVLFADFIPMQVGSYAAQRFFILGFLGFFVVFSLGFLIYRDGFRWLVDIFPAAMLSVGFILLSLPFCKIAFAWVEPGMYALFFLGFVLAGRLPRQWVQKERWLTILVGVAAITSAFYGASTFTVYLFAMSDSVANLSTYIPWGFVSIRYWGHIATWLLPLLPLAVLVGPLQKQRLWRLSVAIGAALWWWIVFLSSSRGTMLGVAFGVFLAAVLIGRPAVPWLKVFFKYLVYGVIAWFLLSVLIPSVLLDEVSMRTLKSDTSGRMPLFIEAWRMSLIEFPLGLGPQSWLTHEIITEGYRKSPKFGHPHNMYLMWAAEYGWLLMVGLLVLAAQAVRLFWRRRNELVHDDTKALPLAAFTASVSAALLHAGVSAVLMAPGSMLIGFLVLSVFWALISDDSVTSTNKPTTKRTIVALAVALAGGLLCLTWLKEVRAYHSAMIVDEVFYYENVPMGTLPRFWLHGNFPRHESQMP